VCEDDPTVRRVIESVLRERGIDVIAEIDVITPIFDLIRYGKPDVVGAPRNSSGRNLFLT